MGCFPGRVCASSKHCGRIWLEGFYTGTHFAKLDPAVYKSYVGKYQLDQDIVNITLNDSGTGLLAQVDGSPKVPLLPISSSRFFVNTDLFQADEVEFGDDANGTVDRMVLHYPWGSHLCPRIP